MKKEEITLKNTKTEILDALNAALEREKEKANVKYEPEKEEAKKQKEKEVEKANAEKGAIQEKLDQAYTQIKEMATKTVEAAGGVKIIGNNTSETN